MNKSLKDMKLGEEINREELGEFSTMFHGKVRLLRIAYTLQDKDGMTAEVKVEHKDFAEPEKGDIDG